VKVVEVLLAKPGNNFNLADTEGVTPLCLACEADSVEIVAMLLSQPGIDVNGGKLETSSPLKNRGLFDDLERSSPSDPPLAIACSAGHDLIIQQLLSHPDIDVKKGNSLAHACLNGKETTVEKLLRIPSVDVNQQHRFLGTPLCAACNGGNEKIAFLLLNHPDIRVNEVGPQNNTHLHFAVQRGLNRVVDRMVELGAEVNAVNSFGVTPLLLTCEKRTSDIVKSLLRVPEIDVNKANSVGRFPLSQAYLDEFIDVLTVLRLAPRIDVNNRNNSGDTIFMQQAGEAVIRKSLAPLSWLLAIRGHEIDLTIENTRHETVLNLTNNHFAARKQRSIFRSYGGGDESRAQKLIQQFAADRDGVCLRLQLELGLSNEFATGLFSLAVFLCDGLLQLRPSLGAEDKRARFFRIISQLPMELQMVLCRRTYRSGKMLIASTASEAAFKDLACSLYLS